MTTFGEYKATVNPLPSNNDAGGWTATAKNKNQGWHLAFNYLNDYAKKMGLTASAKDIRNMLDSQYGRHFADQFNTYKDMDKAFRALSKAPLVLFKKHLRHVQSNPGDFEWEEDLEEAFIKGHV